MSEIAMLHQCSGSSSAGLLSEDDIIHGAAGRLIYHDPRGLPRIFPQFGELHFWILIVEGADLA